MSFTNPKDIIKALLVLISVMVWIPLQPLVAHGIKYHEFSTIDHRNGLNASAVNCIVQDGTGLIWFGTDRGLFSYDGYQARQYVGKEGNGHANIGVIYCAVMVDSVHLWLGSDNGLLIFNTYTDSYEKSPDGLPDNIRSISRINNHTFWIGSLDGLYRYDTRNGKPDRISNGLIPHHSIYTILRYDENTHYFGTYNGLCRYDNKTGTFETLMPASRQTTTNQLVLSLLADYNRNCIWVGYEGGLLTFNTVTETFSEIKPLQGNSVKSLLLDNLNCLWAGTDNGLIIYSPGAGNHRLIRHDALNDKSLINNIVWTVFTDREQNIWIGTDAGTSLYTYDKRFTAQSVSELTGSNEGNYLLSILNDSKDRLWLAGTNGLIMIDQQRGKTVWYQQNNPAYPLPHNKVRYVFEDAEGELWIATDGSICRYEEKSGQFIRYVVNDESHMRNANWSYAIRQDETRKLWIATCLGGLFVLDKAKLKASGSTYYTAERNYYADDGKMGLSGNMLQFLAMDNDRNIWAGTYRAGICKIDRYNNQVIRFTSASTQHPLPSDDVTAMTAGPDQYVWAALRNKIVRIDTRNNTIKILTDPRLNDTYINGMADDGRRIWMTSTSGLFFTDKSSLQIYQLSVGRQFTAIYYHQGKGSIIAGGTNEYLEFDPESMQLDDPPNHTYLTGLWINNSPIQDKEIPGTKAENGRSIRFTSAIELSHKANNLSFTFSELSYSHQQNAQYAHMLEGMEHEWRFMGRGNNRITYNNLASGDYILNISRIGNDGNIMPKPLRIAITINRPWYLTGLAKSVYTLALIMLVIAFVNYYQVWNRLRFERIDKAKTQELTAHKIDFLTNISHELKTPLSLVIAPLGKIADKVKAPVKEEILQVRHNALKVASLIHQMMEASRQEFDGFGLIVSKTDVVAFINSVVTVFEKMLEERNVHIVVESNTPSFDIEADIFKLEIIFNNIISNAAKFAPDASEIQVKIVALTDKVKITLHDDGPGIDATDMPHIFERFYQSRHALPQNRDGSGVGLSIVKDYVKLHNGTVQVISDGIKGTTVVIELPALQSANMEDKKAGKSMLQPVPESEKKPVLLIVEDNAEILSFISKNLGEEFHCIGAQNGKLGLEMAISRQPDAIVTDIMMPVMDGIEMCRRLRENISTSRIPVIMLTARDDKTTELSGYSTGADAFIAKPFEMDYLTDRVRHLLKGRDLIIQKARQEAIIAPKEKEVQSADERFLSTITTIIENELTNPDLSVRVLSEKSGYSLKQIYRRIKSLTGQTAVDYIRTLRLKKAALLLSRKTFAVSEVMYMVGFTNHSYFSKRFQEKFGKTPRQYADG